MQYVILGLLQLGGAQTIYLLNKAFDAGVGLFYRASLGALRTSLQALLAKGHVTVETVTDGGRTKKLYSPTEAGLAAFHAWMRSPITESDLETAALSRLFFLALIPTAAERAAILAEVVARGEADLAQLQETDGMLTGLADTIPPEYAGVLHYQHATLRYGLATTGVGLEHFRALLVEERAAAAREAAATQ